MLNRFQLSTPDDYSPILPRWFSWNRRCRTSRTAIRSYLSGRSSPSGAFCNSGSAAGPWSFLSFRASKPEKNKKEVSRFSKKHWYGGVCPLPIGAVEADFGFFEARWGPMNSNRWCAKAPCFVMKVLLLAAVLAGPVAAQSVDSPVAPSIAQDDHGHGGLHRHGRGGRNSAYGKARIEERDRLLSKLRNTNICRGC
jgi:hypothetical protein